MRRFHFLVIASFIASAVIAAMAFSGTQGGAGLGLRDLFPFLFGAVICGWPWAWALLAAGEQGGTLAAAVFSGVSLVIVVVATRAIATAPAEGKIWYALIGVLALWLAPLLVALVFRRARTN